MINNKVILTNKNNIYSIYIIEEVILIIIYTLL